jgi:hypothetical protein
LGRDNNIELGSSLVFDGKDYFINVALRFTSMQTKKIIGDLTLGLTDNNLLTFKLLNTSSSYIGNSEVEMGIYLINDIQLMKIQNSNLSTVSIVLDDNRAHVIEASINQNVLVTQLKCLQNNSTNGWKEIQSDIGNFYLSFPSTPGYTPEKGWSVKDKDGQVTYFMSSKEISSSQKMSIAAVEEYLLPSMMKQDIQVSKYYLTYSGYNAMDFLYKTNGYPVMYKKGRVIVRDQKLYVLQVFYYHSDLEDFDKFSNSLRFY